MGGRKMERALKVTNADFSTNACAHVAIIVDDYSCTDVTLSQSTVSLTMGGTATLTATLTPANTRDTLTWESNSPSVTVANGVITAVGAGTATITARCGSAMATCTVTVDASISTGDYVRKDGYIFYDFTSSKDIVHLDPNSMYGIVYDGTNDLSGYKAFSDYASSYDFVDGAFPIPIPAGTSKIKVASVTGTNGAIIAQFNSQIGCDYFAEVPTRQGAKCLAYTSNPVAYTNGYAVFDIVSGADSFVVGYRFTASGGTLSVGNIVFE